MKHQKLLTIVAVLALITLSCSFIGGLTGEEPPEPTQPPDEPVGQTPASPSGASPPPAEQQANVTRPADGMVMIHIPAGEFMMGDDASAFKPEKPGHLVYLDDYWMDETEVTNAQYRLCIEAGACEMRRTLEDPKLNGDDQPVLVTWEDAQAYCALVGARLPTEAEWEKAARGTDERLWPWGHEFEPGRANLVGDGDGYGLTAPVGMFLSGASPYGLLDMAGNASEWVADWFDETYYERSPYENPTGPASGEQKVFRSSIANGGSGPEKCRTVARYRGDPGDIRWAYGFRCVTISLPEGSAP